MGHAGGLPETAGFEAGRFPVEVIVVWDAEGGWHCATVLYRTNGGPVTVHPRWSEPFVLASNPWDYLAERLREGRGGNGYDYDIEGFEVADPASLTPIVTARAAEAVGATHGPMSETAGTLLSNQPDGTPRIVPFVVLTDDAGEVFLVPTPRLGAADQCQVSTAQGQAVDPVLFESVEHWQRNGAPAWLLDPHVAYLVAWAGETIRIQTDESGHLETLNVVAPTAGSGAGSESDAGLTNEAVVDRAFDAPPPALVTRVPAPRQVSDPWGFAVPWMHRAVASPLTFEPMLEAPGEPGTEPGNLGYWTALLQMLLYSLGWARPDRGLRWWYDAGRPTDDPRLAILEQVWRRDGHLEDFASWITRNTWALPLHQLADVTGHTDAGLSVEPHPEWTAAERARERPHFPGDGDPYHLSAHTTGPLEEHRGEPRLVRSGRVDRQAVLMLDSMVGWYRALAIETTALPPLDGRSWHVDVVVRPVGWLGTYRRSRTTGLWFAGRHRYHTPGT